MVYRDESKPKKPESLLDSLLEVLMCPVCLETLKKNPILCVNGHSICRECRGEQQCCPTCREAFVELKQNNIIRQVLEVVSSACKFDGCGRSVQPGDNHGRSCMFRPVVCKFPECKWTGTAAQLAAHIVAEHFVA